jgi:Double-GTPase 1
MSKLVAIGLPETGKTTFLAALWHVTESAEVPGSLLLEKISDEAKHLNEIREDWLSFKRVGRTVPGQEDRSVSLWLRTDNNLIGEVSFPDLSGETFEKAWTKRNWPIEYDRLIANAEGLLLFVHPATLKEPTSIVDMQKMADVAIPDEAELDEYTAIIKDAEKSVVETTEQWDLLKASTQVQLVGLLQFVQRSTKTALPIRMGVIISAWDLVMATNRNTYVGENGPEQWLKKRLPFLDQFLKSNPEFLAVRVYGVSAQGGDLDADRTALQRFNKTSERILIEGPNCRPHDISEPVRWCLDLL